MLNKMYVYSSRVSRSALALARASGIRKIRNENSKFVPRKGTTIINWGSTRVPEGYNSCTILNPPEVVASCSNKLAFFNLMKGKVSIPEYTDDPLEAISWLSEKQGNQVCVREVLNGHSGEGLSILTAEDVVDTFPKAPLYTKYIKKKDEYRVHTSTKGIFDVQRKALSSGTNKEEADWRIRNHSGGFVYIRGGVEPPKDVLLQANLAFKASGLDFGAVDVIYNSAEGKAYVLEINTAPGLEGTTLENYSNMIKGTM